MYAMYNSTRKHIFQKHYLKKIQTYSGLVAALKMTIKGAWKKKNHIQYFDSSFRVHILDDNKVPANSENYVGNWYHFTHLVVCVLQVKFSTSDDIKCLQHVVLSVLQSRRLYY